MSVPIEVRVSFRNGLRWPLRDQDTVEIYRGAEHVGSLSGATVRHLIQHHMMDFEVRREVVGDLLGRRLIAFAPLVSKPPVPFTQTAREKFRAQRRARKR